LFRQKNLQQSKLLPERRKQTHKTHKQTRRALKLNSVVPPHDKAGGKIAISQTISLVQKSVKYKESGFS
jgi:hypothetical protein